MNRAFRSPLNLASFHDVFQQQLLGRLDDGGSLARKVIDSIGEGDAYYSALACLLFRRATREQFPNGTRTSPSSVLSSIERFTWAYTELPVEARPPWGPNLCRMLAAAGKLSALQLARANCCDWNDTTMVPRPLLSRSE